MTMTENQLPLQLTERVKRSKTGNNNCRCLVLTDSETDEGIWHVTLGCGGHTASEFTQGHDAKLKSLLIKANRADVQLRITGLDEDAIVSPMQLAIEHGWETFLTPAPEKKSRAKTTKGKASSLDGSRVSFKLGRRVFQGVVEGEADGDKVIVRYQDKGEELYAGVLPDDLEVLPDDDTEE
jgi:hypothetical protein